jgi:DNA-directed RNA polymerase II subunit RPB1
MSQDQLTDSLMPLKRLTHVQFGLFDPEEIKALSVCEVTSPLAYNNGVPVVNGLMDLRMGTSDRGFRCMTCMMEMNECPGHFGHIELAKPCLHIGQMRAILKVLRCVCYNCSSLLLSPDNKQYSAVRRIKNPQRRLAAMLRACAGFKRCNGGFEVDVDQQAEQDAQAIADQVNGVAKAEINLNKARASGCGNLLPKYRVEGGFKITCTFPEDVTFLEGDTDRKKPLSASKVHEVSWFGVPSVSWTNGCAVLTQLLVSCVKRI